MSLAILLSIHNNIKFSLFTSLQIVCYMSLFAGPSDQHTICKSFIVRGSFFPGHSPQPYLTFLKKLANEIRTKMYASCEPPGSMYILLPTFSFPFFSVCLCYYLFTVFSSLVIFFQQWIHIIFLLPANWVRCPKMLTLRISWKFF